MPSAVVAEVWEQREASIDERAIRRYSRVFLVTTTTALDGPGVPMLAPGIPRVGDAYLEPGGYVDVGARCRSVRPEVEQNDSQVWRVRCEYSSEPPERTSLDPTGRPREPLSRPAEISWGFEKFRRVVTRADYVETNDQGAETITEDTSVTNSAGFPFDPAPEADDSRLVLTVMRNEPSYDVLFAMEMQDAVNSDDFYGALPGQAKLEEFSAKSSYENGQFFWQVTYKIAFRREGWDLKLLDAGYMALDSGGDVYRILERDGSAAGEPWPLDGSGAIGDPESPVFLTYRPYKRRVFAALNLV